MSGVRWAPRLVLIAALAAAAGCETSRDRVEVRSRVPGDAIESVGESGQVAPASPVGTDGPIGPIGPIWEWLGTTAPNDSIEVPTPERYTLQLLPDGRAQVRFDCNRGGGSYEIADGRLSFGPLMMTRMACPADSLDSRYASELSRVESIAIERGVLNLGLQQQGGTMRFREDTASGSRIPDTPR